MEKRFVTIHDVAADADVSIATVSRVLNEPWRVVQATREKVIVSVDKLGYTPNLRARLLARGGSGTVCFLLSNRPFIHSIHAQILQGATRNADGIGLQVVYATCEYSPTTPPSEIEMPRILAARGLIDGVVAAGTNHPNMLEALDELELPHVVFGTNYMVEDDVAVKNAVYVDGEGGGFDATCHLLSLGHTEIRFIGDARLPWYRRRYQGYVRAMTDAGLAAYPAIGTAGEGELVMATNAIHDLFEQGARFSALFAGGDMCAVGAIRTLRSQGMRVPDDVSVVGFNDEEMAQIAEPPLTTIRIPKEDVGMRCVEMLSAIIKGPQREAESVTLPVTLVKRQSTGKLRVEKS